MGLPTEACALRQRKQAKVGGPGGNRTRDLMNAIHARSQLRYWPMSEETINCSYGTGRDSSRETSTRGSTSCASRVCCGVAKCED